LPDVFAREFAVTARRALSMWNRDAGSPSYGSFDRAYWGWKAKDFSDATLQYGVRAALRYVLHQAPATLAPGFLDAWLQGYVAFCVQSQQADGSFDQCYPHERTPGVVYDMLSALLFVRDSGHLQSPTALADLDGVIERAVRFALSEDERHGEIANHLGSYAFELLNYGEARSDDRAKARGRDYLDRMLKTFDREEGWFLEYQGPDAGYQTRTLRYLTKCAEITGDPELWTVAARTADFLDLVLMPDGSAHPMLGTRSTALVYPSGFMRLARHDAAYAALAARVRSGWEEARVPLPSHLDFDNAIRLADDAHEAATVVVPPVPANAAGGESAPERIDLPRAGLTIWRAADRAVYVGSRLGGVVVVYERTGCGWRLAHEDSGYLVTAGAKAAVVRWVTRFPGAGVAGPAAADRVVVRSRFARSLHEELTPLRLVALRLLNMSVLRVQWFADLFRRVVVRRLMDRSEWLGLEVERDVHVEPARVTIRDRIVAGAPREGDRLDRCRRVTGTHMATARYFQEQEIEWGPSWIQRVPWPADGRLPETVVAIAARQDPQTA